MSEPARVAATERRAREAAALRANLLRRKQQSRDRSEPADPSPPPPDGPP